MQQIKESILKCRIEGNTLYLPGEILSNYAEVKKVLIKAGATYAKNKFVFKTDAQPVIDQIIGGNKVNIQKEFQAFFTPPDIAHWMAANLFAQGAQTILEPSAGDGALIRALRDEGIKQKIHFCELNPTFAEQTKKIDNVEFIGSDFLQVWQDYVGFFDRIIANPPFSKNQDIEHVLKMWECLSPGGTLISVTSKHWELSNNKKERDFRKFLSEKDAGIYPLDSGRFKSSGTNVASNIITLQK